MFYIGGNRIKVVTGTQSQTVNVLTEQNKSGVYDYVIRLRPPTQGLSDSLQQLRLQSLDQLIELLRAQYSGLIERAPGSYSQHTSPPSTGVQFTSSQIELPQPSVQAPSPSGADWTEQAIALLEDSIDRFVLEFIQLPYLHRVEHSIHCELFRIMASTRLLGTPYPMGGWTTQPIHKEWPEYQPRPEKMNRRGNFDLALIAPDRLRNCSYDDFRHGRLRPCAVVEIGLDYDLRHLRQDWEKLKNSGIENSYLIHLVRPDFNDDFAAVENLVLTASLRTAYARITTSHARVKLLNDQAIRETPCHSR